MSEFDSLFWSVGRKKQVGTSQYNYVLVGNTLRINRRGSTGNIQLVVHREDMDRFRLILFDGSEEGKTVEVSGDALLTRAFSFMGYLQTFAYHFEGTRDSIAVDMFEYLLVTYFN